MNAVKHEIASRHVQPGDRVAADELQVLARRELIGNVTSVRSLGALVAIDTDIGVSGFLPANRHVTVLRWSNDGFPN